MKMKGIKNFRLTNHPCCNNCVFMTTSGEGTWGCERDADFGKDWGNEHPEDFVCDRFARASNEWFVFRVMAKGRPGYVAATNRNRAKAEAIGNAKEMLQAEYTELRCRKISKGMAESEARELARQYNISPLKLPVR
jgi:hypothetical protein